MECWGLTTEMQMKQRFQTLARFGGLNKHSHGGGGEWFYPLQNRYDFHPRHYNDYYLIIIIVPTKLYYTELLLYGTVLSIFHVLLNSEQPSKRYHHHSHFTKAITKAGEGQ